MDIRAFKARLNGISVLPIVSPRSVAHGVDLVGALVDGGATGVEVVLRSPAALDTVRACVDGWPALAVAAGTVLAPHQVDEAAAAGAAFLVSPGYCAAIAAQADGADLPYVPGVQTATEIMAARKAGFSVLKFYPAEASGGAGGLADLCTIFPDLAFMPSGKIGLAHLPGYAALDAVAAVGGTWMHTERGSALAPAETTRRMALALEAVAAVRRAPR